MLKFNRPPAPDWLVVNCNEWTNQYLKTKKFQWAKYQGKVVNQHLNVIFQEITDITPHGSKLGHCCFCDGYPLAPYTETIEHFRPKSLFPNLVYQWDNLFYACHKCQEKNDAFDELLLKPDAIDYYFYEYFIFEPSTGDLKPNPATSDFNQERARITINIYGLNKSARARDRMRVFSIYNNTINPQIDEFPYRFLFI